MKANKVTKSLPLPSAVTQWLSSPQCFDISASGDEIVAIPRLLQQEIHLLSDHLNTLCYGITLGTIKGKNCVPAHALALSEALNKDAFTHCEVDYPTAIAYLRGEAITIDAPRGHVLITHHGAPLGWANNLGNRANNLYPKSLRIISAHTPMTSTSVIDY